MVEYLLGLGVDINQIDDRGRSPSFYARRHEIREYMIGKGARET